MPVTDNDDNIEETRENINTNSFVNPYMPVQVRKDSAESPEFTEPVTLDPFTWAVIFFIIATIIGAANFINGTARGEITKEKLKEMQEKLDSLLRGQVEIIGLLQLIFQEIKWSEIVTQVSDAVNSINYQYDTMLTIAEGDNTAAMAWTNGVLDENNGLTRALYVINDVVMGQSILSPALMQVYAQRLLANSTTQSQYYEAITFFRDILLIEGKGMCALANAYTYRNKAWDPTDFSKIWKKVLETQTSFNKQFLDPLDRFYHNPAWGGPNDGGALWLSGGNHYVDTNANVADEQCVVVGLALYLKQNRLGLKILEARIDAQGLVDQSSSKWRDSPGWGDNWFDVIPNHYVDTNVTVVPDGNIVTGAQLYLKYPTGNRVAIRLQSVPYDPKTGKADFSKRQWTDSPGWGNNVYDMGGQNWWVNIWPEQPSPLSFVTAVYPFKFGNRMALKLNTVYYTI